MEKQEQDKMIHDVIRQLTPIQREIVLLRYVEQWSQKDIAEQLAIHPSNVSRQLKRALKKMRGSLELVKADR